MYRNRSSGNQGFPGAAHRELRKSLSGLAVFCLVVLTSSPAAPAEAQEPPAIPGIWTPGADQPERELSGSIVGTVVDASGAVVVGARVTLTRPYQSPAHEVTSGENGQFSFTNIVPGNFQIRITATGFAPQTIAGTLRSGEVFIAPTVTLRLASLATEIEVRPQAEIAQAQIKAQEKQRILGVVPNFYVSYVPDAVPLNAKQKWELAWRSLLDPVTIGLTAVAAGVEHAQDDYSGYGRGATGYMKRLGAGYADEVTATVIGDALLPALLKQDPRYFYKGTGSTRSRMLYAVAATVICKGDNQRWQPNYSAILGGLASGAISNLYYPPQDRGASLVFENFAIGTATTAALNLLQEFVVPRLTPHLQHKHQAQKNQSKN